VFDATVAERVAPAPAWKNSGLALRERFRAAVTAAMDPHGREAMAVRAMVLGEHPDDDVLVDAFRRSGTLHVFCVSGLHVGMVGLLVWGALRWCQVPRHGAVPIILAALLAYAWMTGMKPPAVRAVVMAGVLLAGFLLKRRPDVLNALGLAFIVAVLFDGHVVFQPGARLSFGVVAAIGLLAERVKPCFSWMARTESYLPLQLYGPWRSFWLGIRREAADSLGVSVAAGLGSLPLAAWHFGIFSPVSVLASAVICPLVFWLLAAAFAAVALSPVPGASEAVNCLNERIAKACMLVAEAGCAVPGGHCLIASDRPGSDYLVVYDVGYGGGAACLHEEGFTTLFDTGHRPGFRRIVMPSLRAMALQPQSIVLSHPDSGHLGGAEEACDAFPVRRILWPVERARSPVFRHLEQSAVARGIPLVPGETGRNYRISSDSWIEVIHAPDPMDWHAIADERVMVVRLHWNGWRILFTADAGWHTERAMLESGRDLSADVIVMSRHAQDGSGGDDFLAAVAPRAIVAGHADFPAGERVPEDWRKACESRGIRVFHQGECGAVTMTAREDGSLDLRGFLGDSHLILTS